MTGQQLNLDDHLTLRQVEALPPVMQWRKLLVHATPPGPRPSTAVFRAVGHVLANHADRLGGSVRASLPTIAAEAGVSRRSAAYALRAHEDAGLVVSEPAGGRGKATVRRLAFPQPVDNPVDNLWTNCEKGARDDTKGCTPVHPRSALRSAQDQDLVVEAPSAVDNS